MAATGDDMSDDRKLRKPRIKKIPDERIEVMPPAAEEKRPGGRPQSYTPEMCRQVEELGERGKSFTQIAVKLGVTRQTLHNWAKRHPEFFDALTRAREAALAYWEDFGEAGITAEKFNAAVWSKIIASRWPEEYGKETAPELRTVVDTGDMKPKTLDLSVVDPEHRDIVLNALMLMKQAAEAEEEA